MRLSLDLFSPFPISTAGTTWHRMFSDCTKADKFQEASFSKLLGFLGLLDGLNLFISLHGICFVSDNGITSLVYIIQRTCPQANPMVKGRVRAYKAVLEQGTTACTRIIRHVLSHPPPSNAFIVHCTVGKDRTGILCALPLLFAG